MIHTSVRRKRGFFGPEQEPGGGDEKQEIPQRPEMSEIGKCRELEAIERFVVDHLRVCLGHVGNDDEDDRDDLQDLDTGITLFLFHVRTSL